MHGLMEKCVDGAVLLLLAKLPLVDPETNDCRKKYEDQLICVEIQKIKTEMS